MSAPQQGVLLAGLHPEAVTRVIEQLREQADQMTAGGRGYHDDPLSYAWLTCLEAAASVGRAIALAQEPDASGGSAAEAPAAEPDPADEELQEAWAATRGAAMSVRLSLYRRRDAA
jgi:hypothetical protein